MRFRGSSRPFASGLFSRIPPGVRWLLIANIVIFLVSSLTADRFDWLATFGLVPNLVVHGYLWQLFTYMFLHSTRSLGHILFNMLALWMFGSQLEQTWGTRRFLTYYTTIGASGALFGLLLAYGMLFPDSVILFMLVFPIKAKYFVMIMGAIAFYMSVTGGNSGVSNVAHVGGLLVGFLYLKTRVGGFDRRYLERRLQEWKMQRAKRKFQVYMRKHGN
jgi:membrane associated rhomboid family serine protease